MIPQYFIEVVEFPQTPNGKIDRKKLPSPNFDSINVDYNYVEPRSKLEKQFAAIWKEILGIEKVGIQDNFIDLGGHSLLALQTISRIKNELNIDVTAVSMIMDTLGQIVSNFDTEELKKHSSSLVSSQTSSLIPFYFQSNKNQLFAAMYPSFHGSRSHAVLLCYPLFQEAINAHWVFKRLAIQLSKDGFDAMRFDYFATGDSDGDGKSGNIKQWTDDIENAVKELRKRSGASKVSIVALRFGATLTSMVNNLSIENLILWDPIINGRDYLQTLAAKNEREIAIYNRSRKSFIQDTKDELLGFPISEQTKKDIGSCELSCSNPNLIKNVFLFVSHESDAYSGST
jgi:alpha/beta superfamily hydrolase/acyl carrier protein